MEATTLLRPISGAKRTTLHLELFSGKPALASIPRLRNQRYNSFRAAALDQVAEKPIDNIRTERTTFPGGFEELITQVCEETNIAEIKLKAGKFELYMKRDVENLKPSASAPQIVSPTTAPPVPSEPMNVSAPPSEPAAPAKSSSAETGLALLSPEAHSKLTSLEASGAYTLISSPTVGKFQRSRTIKGKKQPINFKEGDAIKEGQVIGMIEQFGNELPIRSDVAGEVLKILCKDGEPVGYGDPLVAVLPSFHGIK